MLRRSFPFVLAFFAFTAHAQLDDCGHYLEGLASPHFVIDSLSSKDLEIEKLILPVFEKHLATTVGKNRLRFLLHHPFLDRATILDRQAAVRILVNDGGLRERLSNALGEIEAKLGGRFDGHMGRIKDDSRFGGLSWAYARRYVTAAALGGVAVAGVTGEISPFQALFGPMAIMAFGTKTVENEDKRRKDLDVLRAVLDQSRIIEENLVGLDPAVFEQIARMTSYARVAGSRYDLTRAVEKLDKTKPGWLTPFSIGWGLSQPTTILARRAVLAEEESFRALVSVIGELDVLVALANFAVAHREGGLVVPTILEPGAPTFLNIRTGHHPLLWSADSSKSIANSFRLGEKASAAANRFLLLTGPNTGGKSTYMKMIASQVLLAQIGAMVPAEEMQLTPLALFTNKNANEQLEEGQSSFSAQCGRVADILARAKAYPNVLILADEILTGTSPEEHTSIEQAIIEHMVGSSYIGLLATHDRKLQKLEGVMDGVLNIHVDDKARSTYSILEGPSRNRNAIAVLRASGVEPSIVDSAQRYLDLHFPEP